MSARWTLRRARARRGLRTLAPGEGAQCVPRVVHPAQKQRGLQGEHGGTAMARRSRTGVERGGERRAVELCLEEPASEHSDSGPAAEEKEAFSQ